MRVLLTVFTLTFPVICARGQSSPGLPPVQPVPFSHKTHADAGLECLHCHPNHTPGRTMGIEPASDCIACHRTVKPASPAIHKLVALAKGGREIKWVRVYRVPAFVRFSHTAHADAGFDCDACHGPVATRTQLARETDMTQVGCLACHRAEHAGTACTFCHD